MVTHRAVFDHVGTIGSPQFDALLEHPDGKFGKFLAEGESAIIYVGMYMIHDKARSRLSKVKYNKCKLVLVNCLLIRHFRRVLPCRTFLTNLMHDPI